MASVSDSVRAAIRAAFPAESFQNVCDELAAYYGQEAERVRLDIVKLAAGNPEKVAHLVQRAKRDYRDVITWAEYSGRD